MISKAVRVPIRNELTASDPLKLRSGHIDALIFIGLFVASVGLFSLARFYDIGRGGISTVGAERVLNGDIPYRDFWTMYAPGQFYLLALLFKILALISWSR